MAESEERAAFVAEARTWLGTPFRDQGDIKGKNGAVDCAMLLVRCAATVGLIPPHFDPRPYPPQWHLHRDDERFLKVIADIIARRGRGAEVFRPPISGDVIVYRVARCFSHGGIIAEEPRSSSAAVARQGTHVIHAYYRSRRVAMSGLNEAELAFLPTGKPRPFKLFDLWASGAHTEAQRHRKKKRHRRACPGDP